MFLGESQGCRYADRLAEHVDFINMAADPLHLVMNVIVAFHMPPDRIGSDAGVRAFVPEDPSSFAVRLQVLAGPSDGGGFDSFSVVVCTPAWLSKHPDYRSGCELAGGAVMPGQSLWMVKRWDCDAVEAAVQQLLDSVTATSWDYLANWLGRYIPWEYDYKYDRERGVIVDMARLCPDMARPQTPRNDSA